MSVYARRLIGATVAGAAVGAGTTTTIIAAPGAGFRHRIYWISCAKSPAIGVAMASMYFGGTVVVGMLGQGVADKHSGFAHISDVGVPLDENTAIQINRIGSGAVGGTSVSVAYSTERC